MNSLFSVILIIGIFCFYSLLWIIYYKQYRFASYLFDLLPYYPIFSILNGLTLISIFWSNIENSTNKILLTIISIALFSPQFILFSKWRRNYIIAKYEKLLVELATNDKIELLSFEDYLNRKNKPFEKTIVIIRHDVDISLNRAKNMMRLDKKYGIPATYFFRNKCEKYKFDEIIPILKDIRKYDNIYAGFHFSTLTNTEGDIKTAKSRFKEELEIFKKHATIRFIAAHGDMYKNRQLVTDKIINLEELGLHSAYDINHDFYLSEAGGLHHFNREEGGITFEDQIKILSNPPKGKLIQILIHPDWWF
ncbi:MAG: hypothetical protein HeimC2_18730 [Candidatus Heimdallarchaeota archaeon LC_2]|nr:MAG: hypothetical protein HeimC2_18730 [Candidatus Heimdallarchaeota archaeon LC_2]